VRNAVSEVLAERGVSHRVSMVSNPEFLKEGAAIEDFMRPDRIVIGADDPHAVEAMRELYAPFQRNHERLQVMDIRSAELTKYAANAMLATRISFMNELALLAEKLGADIEHVRVGIGSDPRIGYSFLYPGAGFGGSCFPKDVRALLHTGLENGVDLKVVRAVQEANDRQKEVLGEKIVKRFGADLTGRRFALWGLAFKPNTNDMREASSRVVIDALLARGAKVRAYDPIAADEAREIYEGNADVEFAGSAMEAAEGADALVIVTEWKAFRSPDFDQLRAALKSPVIFDGRNLYEPAVVRGHGLEYHPIGR
jgi:UDPglucose 6-dehydrogenase